MKMTKHICYIFFFLLLLSACDDSFLENVPENALELNDVLESEAELQQFLNASYDALTFGSVLGGQFQLISELMADGVNGDRLNNGDWQAHYTRTTDIFLGTTRSMMHDASKAMARANNVLRYLDEVELNDATRQRMEGEAKFIRALVHFELVRFFAQPYGFTPDNSHLGIPIRTTFGKEVINRLPVADVYNQILTDLNDAKSLLPETNEVYATSWAAKALMARVYFQMNDFENAYNEANDVIQNGPFILDTDFTSRYNSSPSSEIIFGLETTDINSDNANSGFRDYFLINASTGQPGLFSSQTIYGITNTNGDERLDAWYVKEGNLITCTKFAIEEEYTNPIIHLTEMKLVRAECLAEMRSDLMTAVQDLNDIRTRAGLPALSSNTPASQLVQLARAERHIEMYFENNRLHDLKRQAVHDAPDLMIREAPWNCPGMVCQLPDNELKGNPDMEPNEQGGCN